jgi:hypothetical protein
VYGVISTGGKLLAISDDLDHINNFVVKNKKFISGIVKVRKKELAASDRADLILVRYGEDYIPSKYYTALEDVSSQRNYDIKYARDVLLNVLEYSDLSDKKKKHIEKAILILEDEIDPEEAPTIDTMEDLLSMETDYQEKIT